MAAKPKNPASPPLHAVAGASVSAEAKANIAAVETKAHAIAAPNGAVSEKSTVPPHRLVKVPPRQKLPIGRTQRRIGR
jgi:hypothetical protein